MLWHRCLTRKAATSTLPGVQDRWDSQSCCLPAIKLVYYQNSSGLGALKRWANVQHENSSLQHLGSPPHTKANTQGRMSTSSQVYFARHEKHVILFAFVSHVNLGFGRRVLDSFRSRVAGGSLGFWVCRVHF